MLRLVVCAFVPFFEFGLLHCLGRLCGASYINERLEKHLRDRLKRAKYLEKNGKTINSIVEAKVMDFENVEKRMIDLTNKDYQLETIYIDDLQPDAKKGFDQNRLKISRLVFRQWASIQTKIQTGTK